MISDLVRWCFLWRSELIKFIQKYSSGAFLYVCQTQKFYVSLKQARPDFVLDSM